MRLFVTALFRLVPARGFMDTIRAKFPLGEIAATANVTKEVPHEELLLLLRRHAQCDWGDLEEHDQLANWHSLADGKRLVSSYETSSGRTVWIITEGDRSATTMLLPTDY
ncbi:MAG: hypothetical protein JST12_14390 [Armatimonadetes bacterium]|nr:hypothetical protein [Armatimonadota bacterium]